MGEALFDEIFSGAEGLAKTLLSMLGGSASISMPGTPDYDPETGVETPGEGSSFPVDCAPPSPYSLDEIDGSAILRGDCKTTVPASDVKGEIIPGRSTMTLSGCAWRVVNVYPIVSGESAAAFELQLRK